MIKDILNEKVSSGEIKTIEFACDKNDKYCLVNSLFEMLPVHKLSELKNILFDENFVSIMKDADLVQSIDAFFENNLNISETSKKTFLHRNTLLYRLDKIQKLTGFNLKNFSDCVTFKMLMLIYYRFN